MRFLADMGVSPRVVAQLRADGHDAVHLRERALQRLPDEQVFTTARAEDRVVLTFDLDFGEIVALSGDEHTSVVVFRLQDTRPDQVIQRLRQVLTESSAALQAGAVIVVEDARHRVRRLPMTSDSG